MKNIAILGSTGSIGKQALEVIRENNNLFRVVALSAGNNAELLIQQALEFRPQQVVIGCTSKFKEVQSALYGVTEVLCGEDSLDDLVANVNVDLVLTALVGFSGLKPTLSAIRAGKNIALANKEALVVAGETVVCLAREHDVKILPIDSEHSAIFQCLVGEENNVIEKIYLTASGGPFRGKDRSALQHVTPGDALKHPNWVMGRKITIDCATLINKGFEAIEAKWLFNLAPAQIQVIIHPQSIVHSMVQFEDGSIKAQMGLPDMKLPIQYAIAYPERVRNSFTRFDFSKFPFLSFEEPDLHTFKNLNLAYEAMRAGGNMPCILNAANEVVVADFLCGHVGFLQMSSIIENCMSKIHFIHAPSLQDYIDTDKATRQLAAELVRTRKHVAIY